MKEFDDVDDDEDYVQENHEEPTTKRKNISMFKILVMVLLTTAYQISTDIFEQVYKVFTLNIVCSLKSCCPFIACSMNKLRQLVEKQLMNYLIGRNMEHGNITS